MRTTIELNDGHRARLLELAARRGQKGFSSVIAEAIDSYLESAARSERLRRRALRLRGSLTHTEADNLEGYVSTLRAQWR